MGYQDKKQNVLLYDFVINANYCHLTHFNYKCMLKYLIRNKLILVVYFF